MKWLLLLAITLPQYTYDIHISIVFVQPINEIITEQEQVDSLHNVQLAIDFWEDLSPIPSRFTIDSIEFMTTTVSIQTEVPMVSKHPNTTLIIIDNSATHSIIFNQYSGYASGDIIWAVIDSGANIYAHEIGHSTYNLNHYDNSIDIMNTNGGYEAFIAHIVGCETLSALGYPCHTIYIPVIERE